MVKMIVGLLIEHGICEGKMPIRPSQYVERKQMEMSCVDIPTDENRNKDDNKTIQIIP